MKLLIDRFEADGDYELAVATDIIKDRLVDEQRARVLAG